MSIINDKNSSCSSIHTIINLRYEEAYDIECQIPEDLLVLKVPRMIFEPIVENAVQHGFIRGRMERGNVCINATLSDDLLQIDVEDNGCGMRACEIESLNIKFLQTKYNDYECSRIGLFNVNSRIKLLYGDNSGLCLSSRIEGGLRVAIRIYLAEHFDCISMDIRANQELDSVEA